QELQIQHANLQRAERQLAAQQARLLEAYLAQSIELPEFEHTRRDLARKQETVTQQLAQLQSTITQRRELSQISLSIDQFCDTIRPGLAQASFDQKRHLVQLLIDRVVVFDGQVEIRHVVPTRPEGPHLPFCHLRLDKTGG